MSAVGMQVVTAMFGATGLAVLVGAAIARDRNVIKEHTASGLHAIASASYMIGGVISHSPVMSCLWAAALAYFAHEWWTGGGGDGTKRRLRQAASRFTGVRRTAPQGA